MITPILLCGGSGTRLWPLSRKSYPKQFASLIGDTTLFQASAKRLSGKNYAAPIVVTGSDFRFIVTEQLLAIDVDPSAILIEPEARNTAPAILAAALHVASTNPEGLLLVAPSDHVVPDAEAFRHAVDLGVPAAMTGQMITFGIQPTHGETGYGYLELESVPIDDSPIALKSFVEKPESELAAKMAKDGRHLWNSGIFLFRACDLIAAFNTHAAGMMAPVEAAYSGAKPDLGFLRLDVEHWASARNVSIDYAVMEHAKNLSVVPFKADWSDLGGWDAVWQETGPDENGVAISGNATPIDCQNTLLRSESDGLEIVGIGLDNIIAIAMPDAVLVAKKSRAQDVKRAVEVLKSKSALQAESFPKEHRPWGWFESLVTGDRFQVKRIFVHPGAALSLQSHLHRAEHWIVVQGTAEVTVGEKISLISENQSIYIPLGAKHRMFNPGKVPMVLIEVQTGGYFGEDDIIRYDDVYSRER